MILRSTIASEPRSSRWIASSWEVVNDSTESFASLKDARTSLTSERAVGFVMGRGEKVSKKEDDVIDKASATWCNEGVTVGT